LIGSVEVINSEEEANPSANLLSYHCRLFVVLGPGEDWRAGVACVLPDDNPRTRMLQLNPINGLYIAIAGCEHLTIRIQLDRPSADAATRHTGHWHVPQPAPLRRRISARQAAPNSTDSLSTSDAPKSTIVLMALVSPSRRSGHLLQPKDDQLLDSTGLSGLGNWDMVSIGIIGDYDATRETHQTTVPAIEHAAMALGVDITSTWVPTERVESEATGILDSLDALVIAPGSPYRSLHGALSAIEHARVGDIPLLGTCGGFQHMILEFARNVLGFDDAQHAEYDPYASTLFITPLSCSLAGETMTVHLRDGTKAALAYGTKTTKERYYCNFGLNPEYVHAIADGGLLMSGVDHDGEERIVELPDHPFFLASLFVPQTSSTPGAPHPLFTALLGAATGG
jgi:hypothetical protein